MKQPQGVSNPVDFFLSSEILKELKKTTNSKDCKTKNEGRQGIAYNARWLGVRFNDAKPKLYAVPFVRWLFLFYSPLPIYLQSNPCGAFFS
jgi:hypothetical protein